MTEGCVSDILIARWSFKLIVFYEPSCLPLGEGAERSEAEGGCAPQLNIVPVSSNFPVPKGHNANFVWNQDEASVKFVR